MYHLRKATRGDFPAIRRLIGRVKINPTGLDWRRFLLAVDGEGQVLGCGQVKPHRDGSLELASIAVQPESQGQGIGTALVERLLAETPPPLYLLCRAELAGYYQRFGFAPLARDELPPYYRRLLQGVQVLRRVFPRVRGPLVMRKLA